MLWAGCHLVTTILRCLWLAGYLTVMHSYEHANTLSGSEKKDALAEAAALAEAKLTIVAASAIMDELQDEVFILFGFAIFAFCVGCATVCGVSGNTNWCKFSKTNGRASLK